MGIVCGGFLVFAVMICILSYECQFIKKYNKKDENDWYDKYAQHPFFLFLS